MSNFPLLFTSSLKMKRLSFFIKTTSTIQIMLIGRNSAKKRKLPLTMAKFNPKVVLKNIVYFYTLLIGAEGAKTPVGVRVRGDPAGASAEEARRNAHGKRSTWNGNQQTSLTKP